MLPNNPLPEFPPPSPVPNPPKVLKILALLFCVPAKFTKLDNKPEFAFEFPAKLAKLPRVLN